MRHLYIFLPEAEVFFSFSSTNTKMQSLSQEYVLLDISSKVSENSSNDGFYLC